MSPFHSSNFEVIINMSQVPIELSPSRENGGVEIA